MPTLPPTINVQAGRMAQGLIHSYSPEVFVILSMHTAKHLPTTMFSCLLGCIFSSISGHTAVAAGTPISNTIYVAPRGNDSTAQPGSSEKPYQTLAAAKAGSKSHLIYVFPGHYTNHTSLAGSQIDYYMLSGVKVDYFGKALTNLIDDRLFPEGIKVNIDGFADFANHSTYFDSVNHSALILVTNPLSQLDIRCRDIVLRDTDTGSIDIRNCFRVNIDAQNMYGEGHSTGVYWRDGSGIHINAKEIRTGAYALWEDSSPTNTVQDMFADVDFIQTGGEGGIYVSGNNPNSALWVKSKLIKFDSLTGVHLTGVSKLYTSAQKYWITRTNGALFYIGNAGRFWGDGNKATSAGAPFIVNSQGFVDLTIQQYEESGGTVGLGFDFIGGQVFVNGGRMDITGTCVKNTGGTNTLINMTLDSSRSKHSPVVVDGPGLTLQNCRLLAAPGIESLTSATPQKVRIIGTLVVNTKPSTNITFVGGELALESN